MIKKTKIIEYFDWHDMNKLIANKFGRKSADKYWRDHVSDVDYTHNSRYGGEIGHMNLFYFRTKRKRLHWWNRRK